MTARKKKLNLVFQLILTNLQPKEETDHDKNYSVANTVSRKVYDELSKGTQAGNI